MMVKSEQVQFKKRKKEVESLSQAHILICPEGNLWVAILLGIGITHASNFGVEIGAIQLAIRFWREMAANSKGRSA